MTTSESEPKDVREVESVYTIDDHIVCLHEQLGFSTSNDEEEVVLEVLSMEERDIMATSDASSTYFFYF